MRARVLRRMFCSAAVAALVCGCGKSSTAPDSSGVQIALGPQVLRISALASGCVRPGDPAASVIPFIYTRVTLNRAGSEWVATSSSAEAGTVELRFRQTGGVTATGFMNVAGSITGTTINVPDAAPGTPTTWDTRIDFGSDGRTALSGVAFNATPLTPVAGLDGTGSGTIMLSNGTGQSCSGTAFTWGLAPQS